MRHVRTEERRIRPLYVFFSCLQKCIHYKKMKRNDIKPCCLLLILAVSRKIRLTKNSCEQIFLLSLNEIRKFKMSFSQFSGDLLRKEKET